MAGGALLDLTRSVIASTSGEAYGWSGRSVIRMMDTAVEAGAIAELLPAACTHSEHDPEFAALWLDAWPLAVTLVTVSTRASSTYNIPILDRISLTIFELHALVCHLYGCKAMNTNPRVVAVEVKIHQFPRFLVDTGNGRRGKTGKDVIPVQRQATQV